MTLINPTTGTRIPIVGIGQEITDSNSSTSSTNISSASFYGIESIAFNVVPKSDGFLHFLVAIGILSSTNIKA